MDWEKPGDIPNADENYWGYQTCNEFGFYQVLHYYYYYYCYYHYYDHYYYHYYHYYYDYYTCNMNYRPVQRGPTVSTPRLRAM
jgi:hypothetical protein